MIELSDRLKMVANLVHPCSCIADIGTDHAYLPIFLYQLGKIKRAFACDVKKGPLEKAEKNIVKFCCKDVIQTRIGSGFLPLEHENVETAVIAGMGGMLMIELLHQSLETVCGLRQLVLQPQLDIDSVRKQLHKIGFRIEKEAMVKEAGKYYTAISAVLGKQECFTPTQYQYGKYLIEQKDAILKQYLLERKEKLIQIIETLTKQSTQKSIQREKDIQQELEQIEEVLQCL